MRAAFLATAAVAAAASFAGTVSAAPLPAPTADRTNIVEPVASWRYHRGCGWRGGRWVVDLGAGKIVACRPMRPGRDYSWHREGGREGWWDSRRRAWHNDKW